jgi:hypothetical protein
MHKRMFRPLAHEDEGQLGSVQHPHTKQIHKDGAGIVHAVTSFFTDLMGTAPAEPKDLTH